ncbi:FAD-binding oxidoreductase [Nocardia asteroides NBRC 15531]|uniref:FAD-linked oxidase n=1 Tax=Nocardia asteroides NBRC 15531 TaxID=1110697 RepID=U5E737_NOCAS|nr:FAD-binding and (Fe-S)-binding domain-containing protein [Nocardia asteroides]TLF69131.1 FAD-binding oxidoreductase [Nocardia asteroides NBRC 15531]UGT48610.1 FAD-binding oxidoreductase [Nocardia asteroides]SFL65320.1 FAD/FMN-containing dehydrogenase [Nocardia asteroides]VEG31876.1 glycolate oxidase subunit GlcD [Nocardia asteroides]GAD83090.1 putative FAD-linked oxidase [Nocardia asteroides NBRC 15531]
MDADRNAELLADALRARIACPVDASVRRRAEYASDASNYRVRPTLVVFPRRDDDVIATVLFAREHGLAVTARGAGTSVAGNAVGPGIVVDFSRHLRGVQVDPVARTARVRPGVVLSELQRRLRPDGLRFGPDPSTQDRCTLGGMIGNNACGPHALAWGRTSDTVRELRVVDGTGTLRVLGADPAAVPGLAAFTTANLAVLRTELGRFERQASGYGLEHLLPERGSSIAKAFVGTEGTCGLLLEAEVDLTPLPGATVLTVLGYRDIATAADDVAAVTSCAPIAVEGIDAGLVDRVRAHRGTVPELPRGRGWLFVETAGATPAEALAAAERLCREAHADDHRIVTDPGATAALWRIRADGAGLAGRTPEGAPAWPGWEDAAVPPERLGAYLREFAQLTGRYEVDGLLYGHIGDGCIHVRLDLPITDAPQRFREFLFDAAELVVRHGGSLSGEHGDGRARSELLAVMYSPAARAAFADFKALFDPDGLLNPGVLIAPNPVDADLRVAGLRPLPSAGGFALPHDGGDLSTAVHRCVGIGKCRADTRAAGGFMCPSYLATADEKDTTRGRARVLQEVVRGELDWRAPAVEESLDLCLSCKACGSDCPAGVDMATYKSEALYRRYLGRRRPLDHYVLGQLPRWLAVAQRFPRLANTLAAQPFLRRTGMRAVGIDPRRDAPPLAATPFRRIWAELGGNQRTEPLTLALRRTTHRNLIPPQHTERNPTALGDGPARVETVEVMLWVDSFTDTFDPGNALAATAILEQLGCRVLIPTARVCCGLTWITTGQLDGARARLRATLDAVAEHVTRGGVIIGLEPSCTATLRADLPDLLPDDPRARRVAASVRTLAEFLLDQPGWRPPRRTGESVVVQPHCHQHAVGGFAAERELLAAMGVTVAELAGCCGLAGNFGMQKGHYDVSVAVAENSLLPALRAADPGTVFLADGFSCRTQAAQLAAVEGIPLASYLLDPTPGPPRGAGAETASGRSGPAPRRDTPS